MNLVERARTLRPYIEKAVAYLSDEDAVHATELFPRWSPDNISYETGFRVQYKSVLYKCLEAHTSDSTLNPISAPTLWIEVENDTSKPSV